MSTKYILSAVLLGGLGWYLWNQYQTQQQAAALKLSNAQAAAAVVQAASTTVSGTIDGPYQGIG